ncbi:MAG: aromatic ring-hydroxylating dioxygenase subunit alpha [Cyclobacteriaceae bacterium]|nr:aromatic ring-hydroxylating dioxygenase subunit alpha [Cyclobacteriaceae bacterium]
MSRFSIDPNIATARTLDTSFYTDAKYFEESQEKIFASTWQYLAPADGLNSKGSVQPVTLLENFLHESLLLSRSEKDELRCLSNVCTHRGALLVDKPCTLNDIRCPYHGRRFRLDGKFLSMPEFKGVENFPSPSDDLAQLPLYTLGNLLFTQLGNGPEANAFFGDMMKRISWLPLQEFIFKPELSKDYTVNAHWALYCENYLEGFHIPFVHAGLNQVIDFSNYTTELFRYSSLQLGVAKPGELVFNLPEDSPDYGKNIGGYYFFVFPNMMFNVYPWGLSLNIVRPLSPAQTKVSFYTFMWNEANYNKGAGSGLHRVEMEDEAVVESVQAGVRSRFYRHGRYSVKHEQGTHHFHRLIAEFMQ